MDFHVVMWVVFVGLVIGLLAFDLFVVHRNPHTVKLREALLWSGMWIALSLAFAGCLALMGEQGFGTESSLRFLAAYVIEKALSVDNLFVFAVIFAAFKIPREFQHKLLFWGVLGALVLRAVFIFAGVALIEWFEPILYLFGAILIFTAVRLLLYGDKEKHPEKGLTVRALKKILPLKADNVGPNFIVRENGRRFFTMMFVALIAVEITDVIFAVDSVPAALSVAMDPETRKADPFIVYTSNAFAILGLRSLYFALAGIMAAFRYLKYGLSVILVFVGVKMMVFEFWHAPIWLSLSVIGGVLAVCVGLSLAMPLKVPRTEARLLEPERLKTSEAESGDEG